VQVFSLEVEVEDHLVAALEKDDQRKLCRDLFELRIWNTGGIYGYRTPSTDVPKNSFVHLKPAVEGFFVPDSFIGGSASILQPLYLTALPSLRFRRNFFVWPDI
jgi:hypothetical protein